jgi:hypothetical protein
MKKINTNIAPIDEYKRTINKVADKIKYNKLDRADWGEIGGKISGAKKTLIIQSFLYFFENYTKEKENLTLTVGRKLAEEFIGKKSNKDFLLNVFSTDRTGENKVNVDAVVAKVLQDSSTVNFKRNLARLITRAEKYKDEKLEEAKQEANKKEKKS